LFLGKIDTEVVGLGFVVAEAPGSYSGVGGGSFLNALRDL
jgi:hypothetical protein